jgi:hypothetical protein
VVPEKFSSGVLWPPLPQNTPSTVVRIIIHDYQFPIRERLLENAFQSLRQKTPVIEIGGGKWRPWVPFINQKNIEMTRVKQTETSAN